MQKKTLFFGPVTATSLLSAKDWQPPPLSYAASKTTK